uniref:VanZ family protein n=1 Tax=Gemmatimonas sp. TaxID=1962908 RepID=UPI0037C0D8C9
MQAGNAAGIGSEPGITHDGMAAVITRIATPSAAESSSRRRFRRAADVTALRLGRAVLAYLGIVVGIITLAPFRFESAPVHGLSFVWTWSDLVLNVLMFAPVGFVHQLTRPRGAAPDLSRVFLLGLAASGIIEVAQLFSPLRYPSLFDLATNSGGAVLGAAAYSRLSERLPGRAAVQRLALELPLMGLVYLLVPLCWLIGLGSEDESRRV